jgi:hypothetical protein
MRRLNSWKQAALAATLVTTGLIYGCVGVQSAAAENAATPGGVNAVPTTPFAVTTMTTAESLPFPDVVPVEQGATRFLGGDRIAVTEVRGTEDAITPGNIYCIKGTYTLASHGQAMLAAFVTAMEPGEGRSGYLKLQRIMVSKGTGTFSLILPMTIRGSPHVSFYPTEGGESFGGSYFGTGDSVLKQWWGSGHTDSGSTKSTEGTEGTQTSFTFTKPTMPADKSDNPGIGPLAWGVR